MGDAAGADARRGRELGLVGLPAAPHHSSTERSDALEFPHPSAPATRRQASGTARRRFVSVLAGLVQPRIADETAGASTAGLRHLRPGIRSQDVENADISLVFVVEGRQGRPRHVSMDLHDVDRSGRGRRQRCPWDDGRDCEDQPGCDSQGYRDKGESIPHSYSPRFGYTGSCLESG